MLDAGAHLRARRIGGLLRLTEFAIAIGPAMNAALQAARSELFLDLIIVIVRARCKIGMTNLVYNMRRFVCLERMAAAAG